MATPTPLWQRAFFQYQNHQNSNYFIRNVYHTSNNEFHSEPSPNSNSIFTFAISGFLAFLQVQAAGYSFSSSELNRIISIAFVLTFLGYYLASRAEFQFPRYAPQIAVLKTALAGFSMASLVSLCLPNSKFWWPVKFIIFLLLSCEPFYCKIKKLFDEYVLSLFRRPSPSNPRRIRRLLPLTWRDCGYSAPMAVASYQNFTAPATVVGSSTLRRPRPRPTADLP